MSDLRTEEHLERTRQAIPLRRIHDAISLMHQSRAEWRRAAEYGSVNGVIRSRFQQSILDVYEELRPYRREAGELWEEAVPFDGRDLDDLPELFDQREVIERTDVTNGFLTRNHQVRPKYVNDNILREISYGLDEIAADLNLSYNVPPKDEASQEAF